jgi:hypothetical protein
MHEISEISSILLVVSGLKSVMNVENISKCFLIIFGIKSLNACLFHQS